MTRTTVYHGDNLLGDVELYPEESYQTNMTMTMKVEELVMKGIKISQFSHASERCPPLAVLHTIGSGVWFKMESKPHQFGQTSQLLGLHSQCCRENKTAIMALGKHELHLVAMPSRKLDCTILYFWGFKVSKGLYSSSLVMLNLRCLGIVFDLDETLVVANTLKSFEDRIEAMRRKLSSEVDPKRHAAMLAEIRCYQEDKSILRQYAENDHIVDNGKVIRVQSEMVPPLSDSHQSIVRPTIRLQEKNIILTRINPLIRDTSVLVRIRPAWEELRSYLNARGRKRFEVYVCTLAERDYALEMWRLLDPDANLINTIELLDRIVCVKHGARKSLYNVFNDGSCHPRMALVVDDRLTVWDEKDQPRVHLVPPFLPYYAPEAEANNTIPVLCVARNVACNVRGGFFKEFDDNLLQQICKVSYEDNLKNILPPSDVSSYLISEDDTSTTHADEEQLPLDGMAGSEVERRLKESMAASSAVPSSAALSTSNLDPRLPASLQFVVNAVSQPPHASFMPFSADHLQAPPLVRPFGHAEPIDTSLQGSPPREEGEVPESELDPDTRRRLLILQHGLDTREQPSNDPPFPMRPPVQAPIQTPVPVPVPIPGPGPVPDPQIQPHGSWFSAEEQMTAGYLSRGVEQKYPLPADVVHFGNPRPPPPPPAFQQKMENPIPFEHTSLPKQRFPREVPRKEDRWKPNHSLPSYQSFPGEDAPSRWFPSSTRDFEIELCQPSSSNKDSEIEAEPQSSRRRDYETAVGQGFPNSASPAGALHEIAMKCRTQVGYRPSLVATTELEFCIQVYFAGERIAGGFGKTRREAQNQAAEASLINLADRYLTHVKDGSSLQLGESNRLLIQENDLLSNSHSHENQLSLSDETPPLSSTAEPTRPEESSLDRLKTSSSPVYALKELCSREGLGVDFRVQPVGSASGQVDKVYAEEHGRYGLWRKGRTMVQQGKWAFKHVEIDGQVLSTGFGSTMEDAKVQAAEKALAMLGQFTPKRSCSPRSTQGVFKRLKADPWIGPRSPSSRYPRNASPVP